MTLLLLLLLAACNNAPMPEPGPARIHAFTATGLTKGDGEWLISWRTDGTSVTLNGTPVDSSGTFEHDFLGPRSGIPTTYTLIVRSGDSEPEQRSLTVAPISGMTLTDSSGLTGPFELGPSGSRQLEASVTAEDAVDAEPSQEVIWSSSDEDVITVDSTGRVTAVGLSAPDEPVQVRATSSQNSGTYRYVLFEVIDRPEIIQFRAIPLNEGDGSWRLAWQADAEVVTLNGEPVAAAGEAVVQPTSRTEYVLSAANPPYVESETLVLGPVTGFSIQPTGVVNIGQGEQLQLQATVNARDSEVDPSQEVTYRSNSESVLRVDDDGWLEGVAGPGSATVTITSRQTHSISAEVVINVQGPGVYDFSAEGAAEQLEAGESLLLSWRAVALASLTLTEHPSGIEASISLPNQNGLSVNVPLNAGTLNYEIEWTTVTGQTGTTRLWQADRRVLGWVCDAAQIITFDDPVLEQAVRTLFAVSSTEPIRCNNVQRVIDSTENEDDQEESNVLDLNRCQSSMPTVGSLEGIQHLTELVRLELECNNISDIRRLASMTSLEEINFDNNDITDVRPLAELSDVRVLGLYNNDLADITGLEGLESLEILYLSENRVKDLRPLSGLTNLEHVWVYLNCDHVVRNPDPEDDYVTEWSDCLSDLEPLSGLSNMVSVVFHQNEVEDISFISGSMTRLELVTAGGNLITDASPLTDLPALRTVQIHENFLTDLSAFTANPDFPAGAIYSWKRGTVDMPPDPEDPFPGHLIMGYNCFDPASTVIQQQISQLTGRGATVAGEGIEHKEWCTADANRVIPEAVLRSLDALRHSR